MSSLTCFPRSPQTQELVKLMVFKRKTLSFQASCVYRIGDLRLAHPLAHASMAEMMAVNRTSGHLPPPGETQPEGPEAGMPTSCPRPCKTAAHDEPLLTLAATRMPSGRQCMVSALGWPVSADCQLTLRISAPLSGL